MAKGKNVIFFCKDVSVSSKRECNSFLKRVEIEYIQAHKERVKVSFFYICMWVKKQKKNWKIHGDNVIHLWRQCNSFIKQMVARNISYLKFILHRVQ